MVFRWHKMVSFSSRNESRQTHIVPFEARTDLDILHIYFLARRYTSGKFTGNLAFTFEQNIKALDALPGNRRVIYLSQYWPTVGLYGFVLIHFY